MHYQKYNNIPELFKFLAKVEDKEVRPRDTYISSTLAENENNSGMLLQGVSKPCPPIPGPSGWTPGKINDCRVKYI